MINDYRFRTEYSGGKALGRFFKLSFVVVALSFVAGSGYWALTKGLLTFEADTADSTQAQTSSQTVALAIPEPRQLPLSGSQSALASTPEPAPSSASNKPRRIEIAAVEVKAGSLPPNAPPTENKPQQVIAPAVEVGDPPGQEENAQPPVNEKWIVETVKKGDSLARIFSRLGLSATLLHRIVNSSKQAKQLARIKPGEKLKLLTNDAGDLVKLVLERNAIRSLNISPSEESFTAEIVERGLEKRVAQSRGTITSSLYESAQRAGLSDDLIMELANIFGWDIDFALEIRAGDSFSLVYEEEYLDGEVFNNGDILAAEFVNRGKIFRAVRFQDKRGNTSYYSPDGRSMRKAFLRAPVDFRRISSRFRKARWHPVLGKKRPHKGVDYAAATGTPIKASGDGRVIFRGRKGGYGKTVIIKHGSQYTTLYGHMSRFNKKVRSGSRVQQGEVIGYVGKTGLATGPHLHYEFRVNGVHRNPLTVKIPAASPIEKRYKAEFQQQSKPLLAQLDLISRTQVAAAE